MKKYLFLKLLFISSFSCAQVVTDESLADWGFENNPQSTYLTEFCAGSLTPVSATYQSIKAIENQPGQSGIKLRFTLGKQVYQSVADAASSVLEINNPARRSSKHSKMCNLRQAIQLGPVVYFVHTDVGQFKPHIKNILGKLFLYIQSIN